MWGEFESLEEKTAGLEEKEEKAAEPAEDEQKAERVFQQKPSEKPRLFGPSESSSVKEMIDAVAMSGSAVKSQQLGDDELTFGERRGELLTQFHTRPLVFLERYHSCLKPAHLAAFVHVSSDPRALHYSSVVRRRAAARPDRTRVRNQRYAALRALQKEGEYFSEEQMRSREPLLYEQYIGQYLTEEEVLQRSQDAMLESQQGDSGAPGGGSGGLAHLLLNSYQERLLQTRLQQEQEREQGAQEEEEEEEEGDSGAARRQGQPSCEEKLLLREEFISQMHQRFLDGKDKDFNYREVDENPDYDNLDIVSRDAEDKYFDEDDEEEDEEEDDSEEEKMTE